MPPRSQPNLRDILFTLNGSIIPEILGRLAVIGTVCIVAILAARMHPGIFARISAIPFTLIGIALSVFMSFRNSTCYARWWEGRQLWGQVIVACRGLARASAGLEPGTRAWLLRALCAFSAGLAARLRHQDELSAIAHWLPAADVSGQPNPTDRVLQLAGHELIAATGAGRLGEIRWSVLEGYLAQLSAAQAACERIATTPVPFAYSLLLHRTALVFCLLLPFALAGSLGIWTLLPVLLVAYTFFGLDALGHQLEDPFGQTPYALPLDTLAQAVEREMMAAVSEPGRPYHDGRAGAVC
ncbi:bestrophin [Paracoccus versutus]|uniref:Membrane protein n=1 Tax=Paracoccus versutus TaxID=34007 RepID=A0AAQ0KJ26_PARVE|nr:bestrophin family protein [Paracoccus versutus]KGJ11968.1 bestrophin [Paracoccus versutus]REG26995.1 putative membrane protein [Paracoccus versutus]WEJ78495.1 bestrophin [Paracoccus versutus]